MKKTYFIAILCFNLFCIAILITIGSPVSGIYVGSVASMGLFIMNNSQIKAIGIVFIALLYLNILILANNGILYSGFVIPPLLGAGDGMHEQYIVRGIQLYDYEFLMKRSTGLSDNLHVTGLLNLLLCFWLAEKKRYVQLLIASALLLLSVNLQLTLMFIVWLYYYYYNKNFMSIKQVIFMVIVTIVTFWIMDYLLLGGWYLIMLSNTIGDQFIVELKYYFDNLTLERVLFGIKSGSIEDPYAGTNAIPVTDFGLLGVPIQNGILGLISIVMLLLFWFKYSSKELRKFILISLIGLIHYFSIISLPGIVVISWLVCYYMISMKCKSPSQTMQNNSIVNDMQIEVRVS